MTWLHDTKYGNLLYLISAYATAARTRANTIYWKMRTIQVTCAKQFETHRTTLKIHKRAIHFVKAQQQVPFKLVIFIRQAAQPANEMNCIQCAHNTHKQTHIHNCSVQHAPICQFEWQFKRSQMLIIFTQDNLIITKHKMPTKYYTIICQKCLYGKDKDNYVLQKY